MSPTPYLELCTRLLLFPTGKSASLLMMRLKCWILVCLACLQACNQGGIQFPGTLTTRDVAGGSPRHKRLPWAREAASAAGGRVAEDGSSGTTSKQSHKHFNVSMSGDEGHRHAFHGAHGVEMVESCHSPKDELAFSLSIQAHSHVSPSVHFIFRRVLEMRSCQMISDLLLTRGGHF